MKVKLDSPLVNCEFPGETSHIELIRMTDIKTDSACVRVLGALKCLSARKRGAGTLAGALAGAGPNL